MNAVTSGVATAAPTRVLPYYYTSLKPFADEFARGWPMLTYHKLGPRPARVRLKGLYVSKALFRQQMRELVLAGYRSSLPADVAVATSVGSPRIAVTFDDGFENVLRHGLEPLREAGFKAMQFLVPGRIGGTNAWEEAEGEATERLMDVSQVREWLAAGHFIGAHTCTHPRLTRIPLAEAREEIRASRSRLEDLFGVPVCDFCYPYGDQNPAVRDLVQEAGFVTACTTEAGVNQVGLDPLQLRRFTARSASRNWRNLLRWLRGAVR
jgi:peptidoglycan/xylan/chitin deacetylase (PgdA/CDA1 family)